MPQCWLFSAFNAWKVFLVVAVLSQVHTEAFLVVLYSVSFIKSHDTSLKWSKSTWQNILNEYTKLLDS